MNKKKLIAQQAHYTVQRRNDTRISFKREDICSACLARAHASNKERNVSNVFNTKCAFSYWTLGCPYERTKVSLKDYHYGNRTK